MNTITVFANQTKEVNFYPESEGKKAFLIMSVAENFDVKTEDGEEKRLTSFYTVKAWDELAKKIAEEDKRSSKHNKFYKIIGTLVTVKRVDKYDKVHLNKVIYASKIELVYSPEEDGLVKKEDLAV